MLIGIAADHAGFALKESLKKAFKEYKIIDLGADKLIEQDDYPDYAKKMADFIKENPTAFGILICGTGIGMSIAANRYPYIRAALLTNETIAIQSRQHLNANIAVFGATNIGPNQATGILKTFIETPFSKYDRHERRIKKIS